MPNSSLTHFVFLTFLIPVVVACSTRSVTVEQRQKQYEVDARANDSVAEDWRNMGNKDMAKFHEQEADRARHNKYAAGCDRETAFFFDIFGSDACEEK